MGDIQKKIEVFLRSFIDKGGYRRVLEGLQNTAIIAIVGLLIGLVLGTIIAAVRVQQQYKWYTRFFQKLMGLYVAFFRGTPIVVQLLLGYYVLMPLLGIRTSSVIVCVIVFGLNSSAYMSEIMRGGIQSVDPGQMEAGRAVGMTYTSTMLRIVVPQAIKNILPSLGNEFIALIKETSVVSFVGATDLFVAFSYIGSNNYEFMVPYIVMALIYIILVALITLFIKITEKGMAKSDRSR